MDNITLNGRKVTDIEIDGVMHWDAPDYCDAYISSAVWDDDGTPLTDEELDQLSDEGLAQELLHDGSY